MHTIVLFQTLGIKSVLKHILLFGKLGHNHLSVHVDEGIGGMLNVHVCPLGVGKVVKIWQKNVHVVFE